MSDGPIPFENLSMTKKKQIVSARRNELSQSEIFQKFNINRVTFQAVMDEYQKAADEENAKTQTMTSAINAKEADDMATAEPKVKAKPKTKGKKDNIADPDLFKLMTEKRATTADALQKCENEIAVLQENVKKYKLELVRLDAYLK